MKRAFINGFRKAAQASQVPISVAAQLYKYTKRANAPQNWTEHAHIKDPVLRSVMDSCCEVGGAQAGKFTPHSHYISDIGFDSLDAVEHIMHMEEQHGISVSDHHAEKLTTPHLMAQHIHTLKKV